ERLATLERRLEALAGRAAESDPEASRAGIRLEVAERLGDALRGGAPYAELLTLAQALGVDAERLGALESFAASGAPTGPELARLFVPIARRIATETRPDAESWTGRLRDVLERVVTIRPLDAPGSAAPSSLAGRIEQALGRSAFAEAAAAFDALSEPAR